MKSLPRRAAVLVVALAALTWAQAAVAQTAPSVQFKFVRYYYPPPPAIVAGYGTFYVPLNWQLGREFCLVTQVKTGINLADGDPDWDIVMPTIYFMKIINGVQEYYFSMSGQVKPDMPKAAKATLYAVGPNGTLVPVASDEKVPPYPP